MARRAAFVVLFALLGLLALAPAVQARVSIVPGAVPGGGTSVFAFRLANERPDTASTRLELTFPQDPPIAFAEVAGVRGWTATITPRELPEPIQAGDKTITEVVGSIVLSGGSVGPGQFEQFLITLGPLPADGRLVLDAVQGYANGQSDTWTGATAPSITIGPGNVVGAPPVGGPANPGGGGGTEVADPEPAGGVSSWALLWVAIGVAVVFVALVGIRTRLLVVREAKAEPEEESVLEKETTEPEVVGR
jgi:uncharacterized protein YcnI